jgi:predicted kinase
MVKVMKTFNRFVKEDQEKGVVFTFGRFNPPTVGHAKLVDKLTTSTSGGYAPLVYMSHSQDAKKNPLDFGTKQKFMNLFFGKKVGVMNSNARHVFEIVTDLYNQGYTKIRMVVGSDRVKEFNVLLNKYNSVKGRHGFYKFDDIQIISAGERDPDSDDVSGMSASKMRLAATENDFDSFKTGVPDQKHADKLWKAVRRGMNLKENTLPSYMQEDLLNEGVYDQGIFKAVFLMGGPGSGKTTVVNALALDTLGLKTINSDNHFERMMKTANMSMKMTKDGSGENNPERDRIRAKAKQIAGNQMDMYIPNRLGLVFDTTSAKASKIQNYKSLLDNLGYESKMVFVKTSLDLALKLNDARARTVPSEVVKMEHEAVEKNAAAFRGMFRGDFIEIENNDTAASLKKTAESHFGRISAWTKKFPTNRIALAWKERELLLKKTK